MSCAEIAMVGTCPEPGGREGRPLSLRKAIDPDAALVAQLRREEAGAAETLLAVYGDRVYRLAIRITGNPSDAEEVVQDALWAVIRKIDTFRGAATFGSWVYRITANAAYDKLRRWRGKRNEVSWEDLAPTFDEQGQHVETTVDWSSRLMDPGIEREMKEVLSRAIAELPPAHRMAFLLHDVEGLPNPEVAETLQVKLATIKSRVHRARLFLRKRLAGYVDLDGKGSGRSEHSPPRAPDSRNPCLLRDGIVEQLRHLPFPAKSLHALRLERVRTRRESPQEPLRGAAARQHRAEKARIRASEESPCSPFRRSRPVSRSALASAIRLPAPAWPSRA